ncbi:glucose 1-dehydrogenase [Thermoplasma volcanium GSS1]|uniref:Glucose 1-dehydrogenase n=1 Tax=Thermoplasma volcanium (strain ATCC 51530 / DSM 4299 / JCM 9571 / NBRC 15438 / GSS1) TaxID=273116 RepID=Q978I3_THEVO|nr:SDR family oxidoreductase [Thermoplasma volcanium]BAB60574.1 glucose 1-dehydrogenase [Thermoplasma volcanium GSS1]
MDLKDKVAVVTGSGRGIGRAISVALAKNRCKVIINVKKRLEEGQETLRMVEEYSQGILVKADVSTREGCASIINEARKNFDSIDILVNNAGLGIAMPFMNSDDSLIQKLIDTNIMSVIRCSQEIGRVMEDGGTIINVSSVAGLKPMPLLPIYGMTKAAIINLTQYMAYDFAQRRIRVNAVAPSVVSTKMGNSLVDISGLKEDKFAKEYTLTGKIIDPDEVADAVIFLAKSDSITGQTLVIDSGWLLK